MNTKYRIVTGFLALLCLILIVNTVRSLLHLGSRGNVLEEAEKELSEVKKKRDELFFKLSGVKSSQYIEKQAREKLNMGKEGEIVVLLPAISTYPSPTPVPSKSEPNIVRWINLFRGNE